MFHADSSTLAPLTFFPNGNPSEPPSPKSPRRLSWAQLLARVFAIDITRCPRCEGRLKVVGAVTHPDAIELEHLFKTDEHPQACAVELIDGHGTSLGRYCLRNGETRTCPNAGVPNDSG